MIKAGRLHAITLGAATVLLVLSVICLSQSLAEPEVIFQKTDYPAAGQTATQIRQSLDRNTPIRQNGKPFDAYTKWDVDYQFWWAYDGDGTCRITTVTSAVRIRQTFPRLEIAGDLPQHLADRWERYMRALSKHEAGHAALGVDAAREIEQQLAQMGDRSSCDQLESDADALARDIIGRFSLREAQYDADTNYGEWDGARFP